MTLADVIKDHRVDTKREVFYLVDTELGGVLSTNLEFEKGDIRFQLFDCREAAEIFKAYLVSTDYGEAIEAENLVIKSMPFDDFIKEYEYDA